MQSSNPDARTRESGTKCDCYQPEPQQFKITLPDRYHRSYKDYCHHEQRPQHHQPKKRQGILANIQIHSPCARGDQYISHCAHSRQKNLQCPVLRNPNRHTATTARLITQTASSWKIPDAHTVPMSSVPEASLPVKTDKQSELYKIPHILPLKEKAP